MVNNHEDCILSSDPGKAHYEVHGDLLKGEGVWRGADAIERDLCPVGQVLVLLAGRTSLDILGNPGSHSWPGEAGK